MKSCGSCRYFVSPGPDNSDGDCYLDPPRRTSERGGSFRPRVQRNDPPCRHHAPPMPQATQIEPHVSVPPAEEVRLSLQLDTREAVASIRNAQSAHAPKIYCYAGQSAGVRAMMREIGWSPTTVHAVSDAHILRGLSGGVFIRIDGHPQHIPQDIIGAVQHAGMLAVTLSDKYLRDKMHRMGVT